MKGKKILITGASRGLGLSLCQYFLDQGNQVACMSRTAPESVPDGMLYLQTDIADDQSVRQSFLQLQKDWGQLDILINNAASKADSLSPLTSAANTHAMLQTNIAGSFFVTRQAATLMKKQGSGRVISFSSAAVPLASLGSPIYSASKAATEQLSSSFSREYANTDITFNTIGITSAADGDMQSTVNEKEQQVLNASLLKNDALTLKEIVATIEFFSADTAANITGQTLYFGGI